jgi:hypothetical protein
LDILFLNPQDATELLIDCTKTKRYLSESVFVTWGGASARDATGTVQILINDIVTDAATVALVFSEYARAILRLDYFCNEFQIYKLKIKCFANNGRFEF